MRSINLITEVRKRLLRAGFARAYADRAARELHEHWNDILQEGIRNGLDETEAAVEAAARLGSAKDLADELSERMQQTSWLSRNPTSGFAVLALALTVLWWCGLGSAAAAVTGIFTFDHKIPGIVFNFDLFKSSMEWIRSIGYIALPWVCCHVAERFYSGWRAALWSCLVLAIHNAMQFIKITGSGVHGNVTFGYTFSFGEYPPLVPLLAPLAVFGVYRLWRFCDKNDVEQSPSTEL